MSYLKRRKDKRICQSKKMYRTYEDAKLAAWGLGQRAYLCHGKKGQAKHYHLTSKRVFYPGGN